MDLKELIEKLTKYWDTHVKSRLHFDPEGYTWLTKSFEYDKPLKLKDVQEYFDRKKLNEEYKTRYKGKEGKSYALLQTEINTLYSFQKSFLLRHRTRLEWYRDDLAQKDVHMISTVNNCVGKYINNVEEAEQN